MSDNNTNYLARIESNNYKKQLCKITGCCGAASDAWVPSYPSLPINIIDQSLNSLSLVESSSSSTKSK